MGDKKIFLDTNILIYTYSNSEIEKKVKVMNMLKNEMICISTQVINEFIWVMNRKFKIDIISLRFIVNNLFDLFEVAYVKKTTVDKAIDIVQRDRFSYWDSLMLSSGLESGCDLLYSEDMQNRQVIENRLMIVNPFIEKFV